MATIKNKSERDFRLYSNDSSSAPSLDFNKIKVGKQLLANDVTANINSYYKNKRRSKTYSKIDVEEAMNNLNTKELRKISNHFYVKSGIYSRLCRYMAYLFRYDWFITPQRYDEKVKDDKVIEGWYKACAYLENSHLKRIFGSIALKVIRNGCYYGYLMEQSTACYIQELPADYCRSRYALNGKPAVEFNIKFFDEAFTDSTYRIKVLKMFPKEFQKAYIAYKNNTLPRDMNSDERGWFLLDPDKTVKFNLSESDAPLFVSVIPSILDLDDAKDLDKQKMAQQLLKIIIQKMPIDKNGDLIFDVQEAQALHTNAVNMLGDAIGVDVLTTFADVDVADLSDNSNVSSVDELERVERSLYNEAGVSQMQFNTDGNLALEKSIANDEATMKDLILQFEEFAERMLSQFNKSPKRLYYSVEILPTTVYNYKDVSKLYKEHTQIGFSKLLPQIALGHSPSSIIATAIFENQIMSLNDLFVAPQMSSTMSGNKDSSNSSGNNQQKSPSADVGRPKKSDDEKSTKTIQNEESKS